jgi:16S rRNA (guanine966-N2)-methyltransferase
VREALFAALEHDPGLRGANVLDICAGSGALGLEALSRGAAHAMFVESDRRAAAVLRRNVAAVGLPGAEVRVAPAAAVLAGPPPRAYHLALLDPPYELPDREIAGWLSSAAAGGWLVAGAVVVVERSVRGAEFPWPEPLQPVRERRYGETALHVAELVRRAEPAEGLASHPGEAGDC